MEKYMKRNLLILFALLLTPVCMAESADGVEARKRKYASLQKELEAAKQLAPDGATIRSHLAMAYFRLGRKEEAKAEMTAFSELKAKEGVMVPPAERITPEKRPGPE